MSAQGFYFDEIAGAPSAAPVTLHLFADLANKASVNVNVLTELSRQRIAALVAHGTAFDATVAQARGEGLAAFLIDSGGVADFDQMNLAAQGESNAILLAVSAIVMEAVTLHATNGAVTAEQGSFC